MIDKSYQHIVDFIDAVVESEDLTAWLLGLEKKSSSTRFLELANLKVKMLANHEPDELTVIVGLLNHEEILLAINKVIADIKQSGTNTKAYVLNKDNHNYTTLIGLL
ncbi:MAG: hypothetical protein CO186_07595 [Zetaproteobacteria bacterium CG_4_9_14_3_um_filter_49_83]|nr:MAG: hypothetical protein AUJ56_06705 [Zetaproteobacteria bacterium CG1_02_49_23]PIQ30199.1 MAG: hypothetical protein COW62_13145 [Zetaproteobacteria bacterium CG17_big_fil_post_rev_8_21_14_2_50_50_13]PIV30982.1 MAG: hypothetical protein COS35_03685 [Zetaproteobacteria bacterium CG02_land_8_20_14_3_00_50_9]PIY55142.1 MAG: hypothetical protein COZ00_10915 [Zetaproteobacteria bacterium CG_4_10_14_0_8_um_filter_49_80]PJA35092.1 MAG: hypothetical protein CO186_07595 [Zetaproteobacteria bacterium